MYLPFSAALLVIALGAIGLQFLLKLRALQSARAVDSNLLSADRYRPMLSLLSDDDLSFIPVNSTLRKTLPARRRELFRGYLRCLTRDYANLLAGISQVIVQSGTDRPDLAKALARNRMLFAVAICKIELRLALHAAGFGKVESSGLVEALEVLRTQVRVLSTASASAAA